jgi:hypothetical protein
MLFRAACNDRYLDTGDFLKCRYYGNLKLSLHNIDTNETF